MNELKNHEKQLLEKLIIESSKNGEHFTVEDIVEKSKIENYDAALDYVVSLDIDELLETHS